MIINDDKLEWFECNVVHESRDAEDYDGNKLVISVDKVLDLIIELNEQLSPQPTKTSPVPSPKSYLHSCITKELNAIYAAKNSDYGDAFGETYKKLGIISAVTRITDKVNRLQSLSTGNEVKVLDEKIEDTVMDLANYAIMLLIEMRMDTVEDSLVEYTENGLRLKARGESDE